ncbi:MAG: hypothetical protein L0H84_04340 [Pseudonocardia sp.]|nr:hypothetical protein [Pseudonocardia sp.]
MRRYRDDIAEQIGTMVVHVRDLRGLGMQDSTIARRCRSGGPWQRLLPGILLLHAGPVTRDDRRRAALLHGGPGSVLTGLDALALYGMEQAPHPSGSVHVLVPLDRRRTGSGHVLVERTGRLPDPTAGRWPLAPLARAALDAARRIRSRNVVRAILAEVVQRGRCSPAELIAELNSGSRRGTAIPRLVLEEIADGIRSVAEAQARAFVLRSGLPAPLWNARLYGPDGLFVAMADAWFDDVGLAWEIDSRRWHLGPVEYARTMDRRSALMAAGATVLHTQPQKLQERPKEALAELNAVHAQAARRPRPSLRAVPADPRRA